MATKGVTRADFSPPTINRSDFGVDIAVPEPAHGNERHLRPLGLDEGAVRCGLARGYRGAVGYREYSMSASMADLVECGWQARAVAGQRVLPDGCMDVYWDGTTVLIAGPDSTAFLPRQRPGTMIAGIRFHPGIAPGLLGVPAAAVRGLRIPLVDLHRGAAGRAIGPIESGLPPLPALLGAVATLRAAAPLPDPALGLVAAQL
ncbi:MAG: DUF6597 domain-containing transcriptional factor, partial [Pseudonocardia sp.]